jgi:phosphoglycerate dehydrogenase-like enzyme
MTGIYIADPHIRAEQIAAIRHALPSGWALLDRPSGAAAIVTEGVDITPEMLAAAGTGLRLIARLDAGNASVAATHVPVADLSNTGSIGVAEHVITLMLVLSRRLLWVARQTAAQQWVAGRDEPILTDQRRYTYNWIGLDGSGCLYRKKIGIVGFGQIGQAVAARLRPFGVQLLYTDLNRLPPAEETRLGARWRDLDGLLRESDFITLHHRFMDGPGGNDRQFSAREFALMKPTAYFINTSRGRMVDEDALAEAVRTGRIAGAGIDVFRYEPFAANNPLAALAGDNVILTAHTAGAPMVEAWQTTAHELIERIQELL